LTSIVSAQTFGEPSGRPRSRPGIDEGVSRPSLVRKKKNQHGPTPRSLLRQVRGPGRKPNAPSASERVLHPDGQRGPGRPGRGEPRLDLVLVHVALAPSMNVRHDRNDFRTTRRRSQAHRRRTTACRCIPFRGVIRRSGLIHSLTREACIVFANSTAGYIILWRTLEFRAVGYALQGPAW
jgi:hypothetical protein